MKVSPALVLLAVLQLGVALPTHGLGMTPNPLEVALPPSGDIHFQLELIDDVIGLPAGGVVLDGAVGASDVTLVFRLTAIGLGPPDLDWTYPFPGGSPVMPANTAVGTLPGPDVDVDFGVAGIGIGTGGGITYGDIEAEPLDPFFLSFDDSVIGAEIVFGTLSGFIKFPTVTIVPEPSFPVVAVALCALAARCGPGRRCD